MSVLSGQRQRVPRSLFGRLSGNTATVVRRRGRLAHAAAEQLSAGRLVRNGDGVVARRIEELGPVGEVEDAVHLGLAAHVQQVDVLLHDALHDDDREEEADHEADEDKYREQREADGDERRRRLARAVVALARVVALAVARLAQAVAALVARADVVAVDAVYELAVVARRAAARAAVGLGARTTPARRVARLTRLTR